MTYKIKDYNVLMLEQKCYFKNGKEDKTYKILPYSTIREIKRVIKQFKKTLLNNSKEPNYDRIDLYYSISKKGKEEFTKEKSFIVINGKIV